MSDEFDDRTRQSEQDARSASLEGPPDSGRRPMPTSRTTKTVNRRSSGSRPGGSTTKAAQAAKQVFDGIDGPVRPTARPVARAKPPIARTIAASAVFVVIAAIVAAAWASTRGDVYEATAELRYPATDTATAGVADRALAAQTQAFTSRSVLVPAAAELSTDPDKLADHLSVELVAGSDVLRVAATGGSPDEAERTLDVVVSAFADRVASEAPTEGRDYLESELRTVEARITDVEQALAEPNRAADSAATAQLETEYGALLDHRTRLSEMVAEIKVDDLVQHRIDILTPPYADPARVAPRPMRSALVAAVTAGLVALGVAYFVLRRPQLR